MRIQRTGHGASNRFIPKVEYLRGENMAQISSPGAPRPTAGRPAYQAYRILHFGFVVPSDRDGHGQILRFSGELGDVSCTPRPASHPSRRPLVHDGGRVIEIVAGLLVAFWPRIGAYIIVLWLWGIIVTCC